MSDERDDNLYPFTPAPPDPSAADRPARRRRPRRSRLTRTAAGLAVILGTGTGAAAVALATSSGTVPASASSATSAASTVPAPATTTPSPKVPARLLRWRRGLRWSRWSGSFRRPWPQRLRRAGLLAGGSRRRRHRPRQLHPEGRQWYLRDHRHPGGYGPRRQRQFAHREERRRLQPDLRHHHLDHRRRRLRGHPLGESG